MSSASTTKLSKRENDESNASSPKRSRFRRPLPESVVLVNLSLMDCYYGNRENAFCWVDSDVVKDLQLPLSHRYVLEAHDIKVNTVKDPKMRALLKHIGRQEANEPIECCGGAEDTDGSQEPRSPTGNAEAVSPADLPFDELVRGTFEKEGLICFRQFFSSEFDGGGMGMEELFATAGILLGEGNMFTIAGVWNVHFETRSSCNLQYVCNVFRQMKA